MNTNEPIATRNPPRSPITNEADSTSADAQPLRLRIEVPGLFGESMKARKIERALSSMPGIQAARANEHSGRVLCLLDGDSSTELLESIGVALRPFVEADAPAPPSWAQAQTKVALARSWLARAQKALTELPTRQAARKSEKGEGEQGRENPAWHALPIELVARTLRADLEKGLSEREAIQILRTAGPNVLAGVEVRTPVEILVGQIATVPTAVLVGAAGLSVLLGDMLEAGAILFVIGCNVAVGYFSESRAEELLDAWGAFRVEWAKVLRDGVESTIAAKDVVPGDILCVHAGEPVVADARIVWANDLTVDESTLTGESEPAEKNVDEVPGQTLLADRDDMIYAGTVIASGEARAIVVATGPHTELGAIQRALSNTEERAAPLEQQLDQLGRNVAWLAISSSAAVISIGLLRGRPLREMVRSAVALGVAAIPEGFSAVGTTALALVSHKLFKKGIVIRRLAAAETLGAVGVACADKTGTLTENRMRVAEVYVPVLGRVRVEGAEAHTQATADSVRLVAESGRVASPSDLREIGRIAALNADVEMGDGNVITVGSGTERALVEFAMAIGYPVRRRRRVARRVGEKRRSADRPFMTTIHEHPDLGRIELVKGAPEAVIELIRASADEKKAVVEINERMASRGLRVLALAWRRNGQVGTDVPLELAGLVGLRDPPRRGVREALETLSNAGVRTVMLTGDQERTARAIGAELGISESDVRSRVTPEAKLDFVRELQSKGAIVAMTGDGVNDGPALKAADVGIAMGERGTDIARAVADVVLAHDDLQSLASAVREGRRLYDNVRRAIDYLVSTNASEVMVMLLGGIAGLEPLGPLQLLWINVLTDVAPALALALEPAEMHIMRRPPRDSAAPLFGSADYRRIALDASSMAAVSLAGYGLGAFRKHGNARQGRTMAFASLVTAQLLHARQCRAVSNVPNPELAWSMGAGLGLEMLALELPALRRLLRTERVSAAGVATAFALGAAPTVLRSVTTFPWAQLPVVVKRGEREELPAVQSEPAPEESAPTNEVESELPKAA